MPRAAAAAARTQPRTSRAAAQRTKAATAGRTKAAGAGRTKAAAAGRTKAAAAGRTKAAAAGRAKAAPARRAQPARHGTRRRPSTRPRAAAHRRVSGPAAAAPAVALPVRVLNAPFARAARRRTSGVLDALLSGRGWIALVFVLLAGIVFFNVDLLQMNREIAHNAEKISTLKREIARNRLDVARLASSERIQESAVQLGLVMPAPGEMRYLKARPAIDAKQAAKRITAPNPVFVAPEPIDTAPEPVDTTVVDPGTTDPAATDPAATDPVYADPAATETTTAPAG